MESITIKKLELKHYEHKNTNINTNILNSSKKKAPELLRFVAKCNAEKHVSFCS